MIEREIRVVGLDGREYTLRPDPTRSSVVLWTASQLAGNWTSSLVGEHACSQEQASRLLERVCR